MSDEEGEPLKARLVREEYYSPYRREFVPRSVPSNPISKSKRHAGGVAAATVIASCHPGAGSQLNILALHVESSVANNEFVLKTSQQGTLDGFIGGVERVTTMEAPLYIAKGSLTIRFLGSQFVGTNYVSFRGEREIVLDQA